MRKLIGFDRREEKRIFYTADPHAKRTIFSDTQSYIEREKRKMSKSLQHTILGTTLSILFFFIYVHYQILMIGGLWILILGGTIPSMVSYCKHRKTYTLLMAKQS